MKKVRLGTLRQAKLPPPSDKDPDVLVSLRKNIEGPHSDNLRLAVPDEMFELAKSHTPKPADAKTDTKSGNTNKTS